MEREFWEQALARAVTDVRFRARLLADPGEVLLEYGLNHSELPVLVSAPRLSSLGQAAGFLVRWATGERDEDERGAAGKRTPGSDSVDVSGSGGARRRSCARRQGVCKDARLLPHLAIVPHDADAFGEPPTLHGEI